MGQSQQPKASHPHAHDFRAASRRSLWVALLLIGGFMGIEIVGGVLSNSLALLADAAHTVTDAAAIAMALLAIWVASRPPSGTRTFGFHRAEILVALLNALALWLITAGIFYEAYQRFTDPPEVRGGLVLGFGSVGLMVNLAAAWVLKSSAGESLNTEGAMLHVLGDLLGSIGVVVAGVLIVAFGWTLADPILGFAIGVMVLFTSCRLLWKVVHVLMEGTPANLDLDGLCQRLERVQGVTGVHDIHAWSITRGYDVLSAHVTADVATLGHPDLLLRRLRDIASREYGISHVTIQLEQSPTRCGEGHHISHGDESTPDVESQRAGR